MMEQAQVHPVDAENTNEMQIYESDVGAIDQGREWQEQVEVREAKDVTSYTILHVYYPYQSSSHSYDPT